MSLIIGKDSGGKKDYGRVDDGTYMARLVQVIELGLQPVTDFQTKEEKDPKKKVQLVFEFPTETIEVKGEERPRWYAREYAISFNEKASLVKVIKALDPKGNAKSLADLLGQPCMVTIGTTSGGNPKITDVTQVPKGIPVPPLQNPTKCFDFDEPDLEVFNSLPEWMQNKITGALNYKGSALEANLSKEVKESEPEVSKGNPDFDDDLPF